MIYAVGSERGFSDQLNIMLIILIPIGVALLIAITIVIYNVVKIVKTQKEDENYIPEEPLLVSIRRFFRRKKGDSSNIDETTIPLGNRSYNRFGSGSESTNEIENQLNITISQTELDKNINLEQYILQLKIEGQSCSICKLVLEKKDTIVQCPNCKSLFHFEHMDYWLETDDNCPVCSYKFM
jgi:hypothetical protein